MAYDWSGNSSSGYGSTSSYDWSGSPSITGNTNYGSSGGGFNITDIFGDISSKDILGKIGDILSGKDKTFGAAGQVAGIGGLAYLLNNLLGGGGGPSGFAGYRGGIPNLTASREQLPYSTTTTTAPTGETVARRPGSSAINYFKPITYEPVKKADGGLMSGYPSEPVLMMNQGGIASLGAYSDGGRLLKGPGDGVSDDIPAVIGERQPARLADGEFVIPARIVSELGNGSTDAGARKLYAMMERIQKQRSKTVGKNKVAVNSKSDKHLPA